MELIDGSPLSLSVPLEFVVEVLEKISSALAQAHAQKIVHRDVKPGNILLDASGSPHLVDFGLAHRLDHQLSLTQVGTTLGTPQYMAPEQELGQVRRESDVYAMAVCFYEMVTGTLPFQGTSGGISLGKQNRNYIRAGTRVEGLHPFLDQVLDWALDPDPEKRCKTPAKFAQSLESLL